MQIDPFSFLEDNLKEYKECLREIEQLDRDINEANGKYKTNERLFAHIRNGSKERWLKLEEQEDLRFVIQKCKSKRFTLQQRADVLKAYPKFKAFITAAKRRLSVEDWNSAWEEVNQILEKVGDGNIGVKEANP